MTIVTPGRTPPCSSVTLPPISAVPCCARTGRAVARTSPSTEPTRGVRICGLLRRNGLPTKRATRGVIKVSAGADYTTMPLRNQPRFAHTLSHNAGITDRLDRDRYESVQKEVRALAAASADARPRMDEMPLAGHC